jgi:hypothetical protein
MALGSTQPLTEMRTRNISWEGGKGSRCVGLTTLPLSCSDCVEILGASTSWNPKGLSGEYLSGVYSGVWFGSLQDIFSMGYFVVVLSSARQVLDVP